MCDVFTSLDPSLLSGIGISRRRCRWCMFRGRLTAFTRRSAAAHPMFLSHYHLVQTLRPHYLCFSDDVVAPPVFIFLESCAVLCDGSMYINKIITFCAAVLNRCEIAVSFHPRAEKNIKYFSFLFSDALIVL